MSHRALGFVEIHFIMPRVAARTTLDRHWELLELLPGREPGRAVGELVEELARAGHRVSRRTVERDLRALDRQFGLMSKVPVDEVATRWWAPSVRRPDLERMNVVEALALSLAGDVLARLVPPGMLPAVEAKVQQARRKLDSLPGNETARWRDKARFVPAGDPLRPPRVLPAVMATVQQALLNERQVLVTYAAFEQRPKELRLHPLTLILRGSSPYLVARAFDYPDVRLFALQRMEAAAALADRISVPDGYSADTFLKDGGLEFGDGKEIVLRAVVSEALAMRLTETPLADDQTLRCGDDGGWALMARVSESWGLRFWILSQGSNLTVQAPLNLRGGIRREHAAAAERYDDIAEWVAPKQKRKRKQQPSTRKERR